MYRGFWRDNVKWIDKIFTLRILKNVYFEIKLATVEVRLIRLTMIDGKVEALN